MVMNGVAYTIEKEAKVVNGQVYTPSKGAYEEPKTKNIYNIVSDAVVNKKGHIFTKSAESSYVKINGKFEKHHAYTRDRSAFKNKNGNIYKLAEKALISKTGEIYTPNEHSLVGFGG